MLQNNRLDAHEQVLQELKSTQEHNETCDHPSVLGFLQFAVSHDESHANSEEKEWERNRSARKRNTSCVLVVDLIANFALKLVGDAPVTQVVDMEAFWTNQTHQDTLVWLFTIWLIHEGTVVETCLVVEVSQVFLVITDDARGAYGQVLLLTSSAWVFTILTSLVLHLLELVIVSSFALSSAFVIKVQ